jgi:hypothetical protein
MSLVLTAAPGSGLRTRPRRVRCGLVDGDGQVAGEGAPGTYRPTGPAITDRARESSSARKCSSDNLKRP